MSAVENLNFLSPRWLMAQNTVIRFCTIMQRHLRTLSFCKFIVATAAISIMNITKYLSNGLIKSYSEENCT